MGSKGRGLTLALYSSQQGEYRLAQCPDELLLHCYYRLQSVGNFSILLCNGVNNCGVFVSHVYCQYCFNITFYLYFLNVFIILYIATVLTDSLYICLPLLL